MACASLRACAGVCSALLWPPKFVQQICVKQMHVTAMPQCTPVVFSAAIAAATLFTAVCVPLSSLLLLQFQLFFYFNERTCFLLAFCDRHCCCCCTKICISNFAVNLILLRSLRLPCLLIVYTNLSADASWRLIKVQLEMKAL